MSSSTAPIERPRISACIITFNEADRIADCLASLDFCDEWIVVDSFSSDDTVAIAQAAGARVLQRAFTGFRNQKDFAVGQASCDWVLCLDADERISPALRQAILAARDAGFAGHAGYRFARLSEYFGKFLRHGNAYPDASCACSTAAGAAGAASARSTRQPASMVRRHPAWRPDPLPLPLADAAAGQDPALCADDGRA
jgi:Glycosyltransferases involved in cell wall biogenesis